MADPTSQLLPIALEAARLSGDYLLRRWDSLKEEMINEKQKNDFVTEADRGAEELIVDYLRRHSPACNIIAEESGTSEQHAPYTWIIDPLDGTTNYIRKIPFFCVSIALQHQGELTAAVVFNPATNELFTATVDAGATLNEKPISVSSESDFSRALLATGFPHHQKQALPAYIGAFEELFSACAGIRRLGSAALDLCYTACGRFEGFWETGLSAWDIAAGALIVREAGGTVSDFSGDVRFLDTGEVIAGNHLSHKHILKQMQKHFRR